MSRSRNGAAMRLSHAVGGGGAAPLPPTMQ